MIVLTITFIKYPPHENLMSKVSLDNVVKSSIVSAFMIAAALIWKDVIVEAIPGASALSAALSIAGLRVPSFTFYGFLPHKKGRETLFKEIAGNDRASIFYESPHRIMKTLEILAKILPKERRVGIFRELTKMHEQSVIGSASEVLTYFKENSDKERGEFVVIVEAE